MQIKALLAGDHGCVVAGRCRALLQLGEIIEHPLPPHVLRIGWGKVIHAMQQMSGVSVSKRLPFVILVTIGVREVPAFCIDQVCRGECHCGFSSTAAKV